MRNSFLFSVSFGIKNMMNKCNKKTKFLSTGTPLIDKHHLKIAFVVTPKMYGLVILNTTPLPVLPCVHNEEGRLLFLLHTSVSLKFDKKITVTLVITRKASYRIEETTGKPHLRRQARISGLNNGSSKQFQLIRVKLVQRP